MSAGLGRFVLPPIVALLAIGLLAGCDRSDSAATAPAVQSANVACQFPRTVASADVSQSDEALFSATAAGDLAAASEAIEQGANVNATGALKRTPLFVAAFCDRPPLVRLLLEKGGKHDLGDANGMLPLHAAVVVGATETVRTLIAGGANINGRDPAGRTALHLAAATNQMPLVELLLAAKANAAARDKNGKTAAALAKDNGHSTAATALRTAQERQKAPAAK